MGRARIGPCSTKRDMGHADSSARPGSAPREAEPLGGTARRADCHPWSCPVLRAPSSPPGQHRAPTAHVRHRRLPPPPSAPATAALAEPLRQQGWKTPPRSSTPSHLRPQRAPAGRRGSRGERPHGEEPTPSTALLYFIKAFIISLLTGRARGLGAGSGDVQAAPAPPRPVPPAGAEPSPRGGRAPAGRARARGGAGGAAFSSAGGGAARPYLGPSGWRGAPAASPRRSCSSCPAAAATGRRLPRCAPPRRARLHLAAGGRRRPQPRGAAGAASGPARSALHMPRLPRRPSEHVRVRARRARPGAGVPAAGTEWQVGSAGMGFGGHRAQPVSEHIRVNHTMAPSATFRLP